MYTEIFIQGTTRRNACKWDWTSISRLYVPLQCEEKIRKMKTTYEKSESLQNDSRRLGVTESLNTKINISFIFRSDFDKIAFRFLEEVSMLEDNCQTDQLRCIHFNYFILEGLFLVSEKMLIRFCIFMREKLFYLDCSLPWSISA